MEPTTPATPQQPSQPQVPPAPPVPPIPAESTPKKSRKLIIVGIIIIILLIIGIVVGYLLFSQNSTDPVVTPTPTPSQTNQPTIIPTVSENVLNETVVLKKGIETPVPNTDIVLTFIQGSDLPENCADCISTTNIKIGQGGNEKDLFYSCGGIAGECVSKLTELGYSVEILEEVDKETIRVVVTK